MSGALVIGKSYRTMVEYEDSDGAHHDWREAMGEVTMAPRESRNGV